MERGSNQLIWFQEDMEPIYFSHPYAGISVITVSPAIQHQGIGTLLFQEIATRIKQRGEISYLFSSIVLSPITNVPSILFHEKMEFNRIACTYYPELFWLKNYQRILYGKKL